MPSNLRAGYVLIVGKAIETSHVKKSEYKIVTKRTPTNLHDVLRQSRAYKEVVL